MSKLALMESRIESYQQKVNLFYLLIYSQLKTNDRDHLLNLVADFFDALTGGNFGAETRDSDKPRAKLIFANASSLVSHLRKTLPRVTWPLFFMALTAFLGFLFLVIHPYLKVLPRDWVAI
jgi:hypothetical protein